jgi:glycine/D-amino acid oxidase-like deaminating enzyme
MATTQAFARRAAELGATIHEGVTVTTLLTDNSRITGVCTSIGDIAAGTVIVAANAWSPALLAPLGLDLPITATRHPMVALRRADGVQERAAKHAVCLDMARGIYLRPEVGGITLVGSTENVLIPENPDHYAQGLSENEIAFFRTQSADCYPALARSAPRGGWAGLYDDTPDYHPVLDQLPGYSGLYLAAGFSGHGFKLSPLVGQWMADLALNGHKHPDMQPMNFTRFADGQEILPTYASGVLA